MPSIGVQPIGAARSARAPRIEPTGARGRARHHRRDGKGQLRARNARTPAD